MKCPKCGLLNPPEAQRCDCGYDFASRTMQPSYLTPAPPERQSWLRKNPVAWAVCCSVALVAAAIAAFLIEASLAAASPGVTGTGVGNLGDMLFVAFISAVLIIGGLLAMLTSAGRVAGSVCAASGLGGCLGVAAFFAR